MDRKITVPLGTKSLVLGVNEAIELADNIASMLASLDETLEPMIVAPPALDDGFITREALTDFFAQFYTDPVTNRAHTGRVHKHLIRTLTKRDSQVVRCAACKGGAYSEDCRGYTRSGHYVGTKSSKLLEVSAATIKAQQHQYTVVFQRGDGLRVLYEDLVALAESL